MHRAHRSQGTHGIAASRVRLGAITNVHEQHCCERLRRAAEARELAVFPEHDLKQEDDGTLYATTPFAIIEYGAVRFQTPDTALEEGNKAATEADEGACDQDEKVERVAHHHDQHENERPVRRTLLEETAAL